MIVFFQIICAYIYSHFLEYYLHKNVLHNKKFKQRFKFHFGNHHRVARTHDMIDIRYNNLESLYRGGEIRSLLTLLVLHLPVYFYFPYAYFTLIFASLEYYVLHRLSHTRKEWARKYLSWHYDHHMGKSQNMNWGVRLPLIDKILGSREYFKNTKRERLFRNKNKKRRPRG